MLFDNITNKNFLVYSMRYYDNPHCKGVDEFQEDLDRIKHIKRLFRRYRDKQELRERLIINHIVTFTNCFSVQAGIRMLFFRIEEDLWSPLKTILLFLNFMPDEIRGVNSKVIRSSDIPVDMVLVEKLRQI